MILHFLKTTLKDFYEARYAVVATHFVRLIVISLWKNAWSRQIANQFTKLYSIASTGNKVFKAQIYASGARITNKIISKKRGNATLNIVNSKVF
jgi:hypothetical protein